MVIVTLTLVIGVATKLIRPLSDYMKNYAGVYVECLLETGDLPPPFSNPNSECTIERMQASGRLANSTSSGGSSGSGSNSNRNTSNTNPTPINSNSGGGSGRSSASTPRLQTGANTGADGGYSESSGNNSETGNKVPANDGGNNEARRSRSNGEGTPYITDEESGRGITGEVRIPNKSKPTDPNAPVASIKKGQSTSGDDLRKGSFSAPISKKVDRDPSQAQNDLGFQFGLYLRYLIIGGILLALIIMVGTQINSLRKSWGNQ